MSDMKKIECAIRNYGYHRSFASPLEALAAGRPSAVRFTTLKIVYHESSNEAPCRPRMPARANFTPHLLERICRDARFEE